MNTIAIELGQLARNLRHRVRSYFRMRQRTRHYAVVDAPHISTRRVFDWSRQNLCKSPRNEQ